MCKKEPLSKLHNIKKVPLNRCFERCTAIQIAERNVMFVEMLYYDSSDNWLGQIELMAKFGPAMNEHVRVRRSVNKEKISL